MLSVITSNNNSDQFQSIKRRYGEYNNVIQDTAKQFRALILKLRNFSSKNERIINEISSMVQLLEKRLNEVRLFNKDVRQLEQDIINIKTATEREHTKNVEDSEKLRRQINDLKKNQERTQESQRELEKERDNEQANLERLRREKKDLSERQERAAIASGISGGVAAVCAIGGFIFPLLEIPAILLVSGATGVSVSSLTAVGIMETMKASEERLSLMKEKIEEHRKRIVSSQGNIRKFEEECKEKSKKREYTEVAIKEAKEKIQILGQYLPNTNSWVDLLTEWIAFLNKIEPEAKRIEGHIDGNERALQRATEEFRDLINSSETKQLEESARLGLTN